MVSNTIRRALLATLGLASAACSDQSVTVELRSLQSSGDVSYVCRATDGTGTGLPLADCHAASLFRNEADLYALVTQTSTGEVAVINVPLDPDDQDRDEGVVDVDRSTPGFGFLRVGGRPTDVVSTPGGFASFVATAETGTYGVFGLPTACVGAPAEGELARDLTTWPACRLPSAPGRLELLLDPALSCAEVAFADRGECATDLSLESGPAGRRKLLVALPDAGSLVVIDAQWLLNQPVGAFPDCQLDAEYPLSAELPLVLPEQRLPSDLNECARAVAPEPPAPAVFTSRPSGLAHGDGVLYVSDDSAPLVHVLDVSRPCAATELLPLVPRSFDAPESVVKTSGVALSPLTPSGKRFLYAIDDDGDLMIFDVSPDSTERTPIVRPGAPFLPFESPDRIAFDGEVKDVTFLVRDRPVFDPATGATVIGQACEPSPELESGPGAGFPPRPNDDYSEGARAAELRGVFAAVALSRGTVALVDVEDFDAPCRRPVGGNRSSEEDFRGCAGDPFLDYRLPNGTPTVTDEVSCRMVEPHRPRSASLGITSTEVGIRAPSLSAFPQLAVPAGSAQLTQEDRPKLLGVGFPVPEQPGEKTPAQVFVGTTLYTEGASSQQGVSSELVTDPSLARQYSVVLPYNEPRAYAERQDVSLTFEGPVTVALSSGFLRRNGAELELADSSANYCDRGVHDPELIGQVGAERFALAGDALETFKSRHGDYASILSDFPDEEEDREYWRDNRSCNPEGELVTRRRCEQLFGEIEEDDLDSNPLFTNRDFRILDADQVRLGLEPRAQDPVNDTPEALEAELARRAEVARLAPCCFPTGLRYVVRASEQWILVDGAYRHDVVAEPETLNCIRDCNPKKSFFDSRVFEIAASSCAMPPELGQPDSCGIGRAGPDDVCAIDGRAGGVSLDEPAASCVHTTPTARFAVYRGNQPSARGMTFRWQTTGGFRAMSLNLAVPGVPVLPQSIVGLRDLDWLTVVDAESLGLTVVDLNELSVLTPTLN